MVFRPSYNPFSSCDTKAGGDAVFGVGMTGISFQAPSSLVIPQPDCAVVRSREDVFRVGGELDVLAENTGY